MVVTLFNNRLMSHINRLLNLWKTKIQWTSNDPRTFFWHFVGFSPTRYNFSDSFRRAAAICLALFSSGNCVNPLNETMTSATSQEKIKNLHWVIKELNKLDERIQRWKDCFRSLISVANILYP